MDAAQRCAQVVRHAVGEGLQLPVGLRQLARALGHARLQLVVELLQRQLRRAHLGDVQHRAHAAHRPVAVVFGRAPLAHVFHPPAGQQHPVHHVVGPDRGVEGLLHHGAVVRVHQIQETLERRLQQPRIDLEDAVHLVGPQQPARSQVVLPAAQARQLLCLFQPRLAARQRPLAASHAKLVAHVHPAKAQQQQRQHPRHQQVAPQRGRQRRQHRVVGQAHRHHQPRVGQAAPAVGARRMVDGVVPSVGATHQGRIGPERAVRRRQLAHRRLVALAARQVVAVRVHQRHHVLVRQLQPAQLTGDVRRLHHHVDHPVETPLAQHRSIHRKRPSSGQARTHRSRHPHRVGALARHPEAVAVAHIAPGLQPQAVVDQMATAVGHRHVRDQARRQAVEGVLRQHVETFPWLAHPVIAQRPERDVHRVELRLHLPGHGIGHVQAALLGLLQHLLAQLCLRVQRLPPQHPRRDHGECRRQQGKRTLEWLHRGAPPPRARPRTKRAAAWHRFTTTVSLG